MHNYIYLLRVKQNYYGIRNEVDFAFQSSVHVSYYLKELWRFWEEKLPAGEFELLPDVPTLDEIRNEIKQNTYPGRDYTTIVILGIGMVDENDRFSVYATITRMPVL